LPIAWPARIEDGHEERLVVAPSSIDPLSHVTTRSLHRQGEIAPAKVGVEKRRERFALGLRELSFDAQHDARPPGQRRGMNRRHLKKYKRSGDRERSYATSDGPHLREGTIWNRRETTRATDGVQGPIIFPTGFQGAFHWGQVSRQLRAWVTPGIARASGGALALGLVCGCASSVEDTVGSRDRAGAAGGASSATSGPSTGAAGASQTAGGGAAGTSATTGGGSACRFACPDDSGISVGPGPGPEAGPDASAQDAGRRDASTGPTDAAPPGSGCTPDLRLCDDFESYGDGKVPDGKWQTIKAPSTGASLVVDTTKAFSGTKALHVKINFTGNGGSVDVGTKQGDPAFANLTNNTMFARFMLFQSALNVSGELHARLLRLGSMNAPSGSNQTGYAFALHSYPIPVALQLESMNDLYVSTRVPPVVDRWVCWEMQLGQGVVGWWKDGQVVASPVPGGWPTVPLQMLEVGFDTFTPVSTEFWIDDVAIDTKRVGCPAPQ
jgi:hypothetical protein